MKVIFVLAALVCSAYAEFTLQTGEDLIKYRDECVTKLEISPETVEQFKKWQFSDDKSACYLHCVFEKMNLYEGDNFLVDNLVTQLSHGETPADNFKTDITNCIDNSLTDNCQKVFKGFNCFKENNLYMIKKSIN